MLQLHLSCARDRLTWRDVLLAWSFPRPWALEKSCRGEPRRGIRSTYIQIDGEDRLISTFTPVVVRSGRDSWTCRCVFFPSHPLIVPLLIIRFLLEFRIVAFITFMSVLQPCKHGLIDLPEFYCWSIVRFRICRLRFFVLLVRLLNDLNFVEIELQWTYLVVFPIPLSNLDHVDDCLCSLVTACRRIEPGNG